MKFLLLIFIILNVSCASQSTDIEEDQIDEVSATNWKGLSDDGEKKSEQWDGHSYIDEDLFATNKRAMRKYKQYQAQANAATNYLWYGLAAGLAYFFSTDAGSPNRTMIYTGIFAAGAGIYVYKSQQAEEKLEEAIQIYRNSIKEKGQEGQTGFYIRLDF